MNKDILFKNNDYSTKYNINIVDYSSNWTPEENTDIEFIDEILSKINIQMGCYYVRPPVFTSTCTKLFNSANILFLKQNVSELHNYSIEFDLNTKQVNLNIDTYLQSQQTKSFPIIMVLRNIWGSYGHVIMLYVNNNQLEILDPSHATEIIINRDLYDYILNIIVTYINKFGFSITKIVYPSSIIPNIQEHEEKSLHFISEGQRNEGNCSYWSVFLYVLRKKNIKMTDTEFYKYVENIVGYIEKKTRLYLFISVFANYLIKNDVSLYLKYIFNLY